MRAFRARALGSGAVTGVVALGGLFVLRDDSPALYDGLTSGGGLAMVVVSALAGAVTLALVWSERYGLARLTSALAVAAIVVGWALAQDPYFLPGELTLEQAAAPDAVLGTVLGSMAVGALILAPSLWWLYRLTLQGTPRQGLRAPRPALPPVKLRRVHVQPAWRRPAADAALRGLVHPARSALQRCSPSSSRACS